MTCRPSRTPAQSPAARRGRRIALTLACALSLLSPRATRAVDWTGVAGPDFNNLFNWNPLGVPDNTEAAVIALDSADVTTSAFAHVEDLSLLNGAQLSLTGGGMLVDDRTTLNRTTGAAVDLSIFNTPAALDLDTNYLDILGGAILYMEGGMAQVDLNLENLGYISGNGVIEMSGGAANSLNNDSSINVTGGTLSLLAPNGARFNLDGPSGNGIIYVTESTSDLIVDGPLLDPFNGVLNVGDGNTVTFTEGWELSAASGVAGAGFLNMNGNGAGGAARVNGLSSVISGIIEVSGQGQLATDTIEITDTAHVQVDSGATLSLAGETTFAGGLYTGLGQISQDGDAIFTANTTIETGSYDMDGVSGDTRITIENLVLVHLDVVEVDDASNFYNGELVLQGGRLSVDTSTNNWTIAGSLHMDGSNAGAILSGDDVNITGSVDVTGPSTGSLLSNRTYFYNSTAVDVAAGSELAVADTVVYGGQFQGGTLRNDGDMLVTNNDVTFNHATFDMDGDYGTGTLTVSFGSLTINANAVEDDDAGFDGLLLVESSGELAVYTPNTWNIEDGTLRLGGPGAVVSGQDLAIVDAEGRLEGIGSLLVDVTSEGVISPGTTAVGLLEISQDLTLLSTSTLDVEIGGDAPSQYDRLLVDQTTVLGGTLDLTVINGFIPEYGDAYTILTTNGELVECFAGIAGQDIVGPLVLAHDYTPDGVVIRPTVPGDANFDGTVTGADFTLWADNFGGMCPDFGEGDFNGDSAVTGADFTIWADHFGAVAPAAVAVPEPTTLLLALSAGLLVYGCRLHRRLD